MMVSPISSVRFGNSEIKTLDLAREGAHAKAASQPETATAAADQPKKSSTGKKVLKTIVGLAVVAAVLAALPKVFSKAIAKIEDPEVLKNSGIMKKVGHYLAKTGEAIGKYTYEPIVKLVKKAPQAE